uniref:Uncharacterized protein n=1 Tax=Glossina pallidipes TaxID=7398 RepID=A0A1A9ZUI2_GLOPL
MFITTVKVPRWSGLFRLEVARCGIRVGDDGIVNVVQFELNMTSPGISRSVDDNVEVFDETNGDDGLAKEVNNVADTCCDIDSGQLGGCAEVVCEGVKMECIALVVVAVVFVFILPKAVFLDALMKDEIET